MESAPLRAFVFIRQGECVSLTVHRDLITVTAAWHTAANSIDASMLLHVGFDRPETGPVGEMLLSWPGRVLVTEPARLSLPSSFACSSTPVGYVVVASRPEPYGIYIGTQGWGYSLSADLKPSSLTEVPTEPWLLALTEQFPDLYTSVQALGVSDDQQYVDRRKDMPVDVRDRIDDFRFSEMLSRVPKNDPFALLQIAPEWLLHFPMFAFDDLPLRARNAFQRAAIHVVGHIGRLTLQSLLSLENFGKKSYESLAPALLALAARQPYRDLSYPRDQVVDAIPNRERNSSAIVPHQIQYRTLWSGVQMALQQMAPRVRMVVEERLGWCESPRTLDALGASLGVTRERARQLEAAGLREFVEKTWASELTRRIALRFLDRREPLFLDLLAIEDDWFEGFERCIPFLGQIIERLHENTYWAWRLNGREIVARIREGDWETLQRTTKSALSTQASAALTASDVRLFIEATANSARCPELSTTLIASLWEELQFARDPELGTEVFIEVGSSIRSVVSAILAESHQPMDLRSIAVRCAERMGETPSDMSVRSALTEAGAFPFSGRRYALERQIGLSENEIDDLLTALEQILNSGPAGKQWHCSELLVAVRNERPDLPACVDQYVVNVVLHRSRQANDLGRFIWAAKGSAAVTTRDRLEIADVIEVILQEAGGPLAVTDLKDAVSRIRGLNTLFQVFPSERVARVDSGIWGLVDRDFGIAADERAEVLDTLFQILEARRKALHISELRVTLGGRSLALPENVTNEMIFGLCQTDDRFRFGAGQLMGLSNWVSLNRLSVRAAIREAVKEQGDRISLPTLYQRVNELAERKVERQVIHNDLRELGFAYNAESACWVREDDIESDVAEQ